MSALLAVILSMIVPVGVVTSTLAAQTRTKRYPLYTAQATGQYQLAPSALVSLAHQGGLSAYGIPGFMLLTSAYALGQIDATKLVAAAIRARLLPESAAQDPSYLQAVTAQLDAQEGFG